MPSIRLDNDAPVGGGDVAAERRKRLLDSGEGRGLGGRPRVVADYPLRRAYRRRPIGAAAADRRGRDKSGGAK